MADSPDRFCFNVEWFDVHAELSREYQLYFCPTDQTVEMYDPKSRRTFLKRTQFEGLRVEDLYIGAAVNVYSRQLVVVDYGDLFTKTKFGNVLEKSFLAVNPIGFQNIGKIIDALVKSGFHITGLKTVNVKVLERYLNIKSESSNETGTTSLVIQGNKENAISALQALQKSNPLFTSIYVPTTPTEASNLIKSFFGSEANQKIPRTGLLQKGSTLAIIKPHSINSGQTGLILDDILKAGFSIRDMENFHLDTANAEEFLEVYKDVLNEYPFMLDQLTSGQVIAMEIGGRSNGANVVSEFREFCGPICPEIARHIRPNSIRAKFGRDKIKNAIHCTDLPDDGALEVEYFFKILVS